MAKPRLLVVTSSGQALLLAMLLVLILTIASTAVFFMNRIGTVHQTASAQRTKSRAGAEDGLSYAIHQLSQSTTTWQHALDGDFLMTDCNTASPLVNPSGGHFKLYCSTGTIGNPGLQPYQVAVVVVATVADGAGARAVQAYLSRRTLGADLATTLHAPAALQVVRKPITAGSLDVYWGSIVCLDSQDVNSWVLPDPIDTGRLSGSISSTDQKEYYANAPMTPPPLIDETYYLNQSIAASNGPIAPPTLGVGGPGLMATQCAVGSTCGFFDTSGGTAVFDSPNGNGYSVPSGAVIWVKGNAQFGRIAIDHATFVITGDLTLTNPANGGNNPSLHVPVSAPLEYPYGAPTPPTGGWSCINKAGDMTGSLPAYDCDSTSVFSGPVHFHGFLYVKGNLIVNTPTWNMVGSLLEGDVQIASGTGGRLTIGAGDSLNVAYDDLINHEIRTTSVILAPDVLRDVSAF
jgi:hypothetical protein